MAPEEQGLFIPPFEQGALQPDCEPSDQGISSSPLPQEPEPTQHHRCDEFATEELWQEVRQFCDGDQTEVEMESPSTSPSLSELLMPPPLSYFLEMNNIKVRQLPSTTPDKHFLEVDTRLNLPLLIAKNDVHSVAEDLERRLQLDVHGANVLEWIRQVLFPIQELNNPCYKLLNAHLSVGELRFDSTWFTVIKEVKAEVPPQRNRRAAGPQSRAASRSMSQSAKTSKSGHTSQHTSQVTKHPMALGPTQPIWNHFYPPDTLLPRLFPHATFWLTAPNPAKDSLTGVVRDGLMFPYLTILEWDKVNPISEVEARAALISSCILSSYVKKLKSGGCGDGPWRHLRHYVIFVDNCGGFRVFQTVLAHDACTGYHMLKLDGGSVSANCERFELWIGRIHDWALRVWKPMMMTAFSPEYFDYDGSEVNEVNADLQNEARDTTDKWAGA